MSKPKIISPLIVNGINIDADKKLAQTSFQFQIPSQVTDEASKKVLENASLCYYGGGKQNNSVQDNVPVPTGNPMPTDERYVYATFRGLSQIYLPNRGLDFSKKGVLEAGVELLKGKTVYPNHDFRDVNNWLGVVSNSFWDASGEKSGGVSGINCEIKIDAFLNYRIACGVMMTPPAINSMSLTVLFEFEYSHPQLVEERRFWNLLGEEVDGDIVRLIVVKIVDFWEASLVFLGEDRLAKNHGRKEVEQTEDNEDFDDESLSAANQLPTNSNEEKTMKIEKQKRTELGIEFDGDDVPETEIFKAAENLAAKNKEFEGVNLAELKKKAKQTDALMTAKREEVTRLATIAELGAEEGELDEVVTLSINDADADTLIKLEKYYGKKAAEKFPDLGRSSFEGKEEIEKAGGVNKTTKPKQLPKVKR